jgi:hypothetical protein
MLGTSSQFLESAVLEQPISVIEPRAAAGNAESVPDPSSYLDMKMHVLIQGSAPRF